LWCSLFARVPKPASDADSGISMSEEKMNLSAIAVDNNLYVLGGITASGESVADFAMMYCMS